MKVFKKHEHAPVFRPFGVGGKLWLSVACLTFFELSDDPAVLTEQDMWKTLPPALGPGGVLDAGLPKPVGEVLVTGSCFAPGRVPAPASEVSVRVGAVSKRLLVFGDRFWRSGSTLAADRDGPRPFAEMPLTWERAFGGPGFEANPLGRGAVPVAVPGEAGTILPLPNVEHPDRLVAGPRDAPEPAGLTGQDVMAPSRKARLGTYDAVWQREHWPYFPADYDWAFANEAQTDQWLAEGHFQGGEAIEIRGMHPDKPVLASRVPEIRVRVFATQVERLGPGGRIPKDAAERFVEIPTRIDTVRLFPGVERGVAVHRGLLPIADDEYRDVRRLFFATERLADPPRPVEDYAREQQKLLDRMVPVAANPTAEIEKKISRAMLKVKAVPGMIEAAKKRALGQTPVMPAATGDLAGLSASLGADLTERLGELEAMAKGMHAKYGHLARIDLGQFDRFRADIAKAQDKSASAMAKADAAQAKGQAALAEAKKTLREKVKPEHLAKAGVDPDALGAPRKVNPWHDAAFPLAVEFRRNLEREPKGMARLKSFGLARTHTDRLWLGYNPGDREFPGPAWGLPEGETVLVPKGLTVTEFSGAVCDRLGVFALGPDAYYPFAEEVLVAGSARRAVFIPSLEGAPVVVVPKPLGAMILAEEAGDFAAVLAASDPGVDLSPEAAQAIKRAPALLVVLLGDERAWIRAETGWRKLHPMAEPLFLPRIKFVSEAKAAGIGLREQILDALPPAAVGLPEAGREPGRPAIPPFPDVKGLILAAIDEVKAAIEPRFDKAKALQAGAMDMAKAALAKAGQDPEAVLAKAASAPRPTLADGAKQAASALDKAEARLRAIGQLTPERAAALDKAKSTVASTFADADKRLAEGKAELEAGKKRIAEAMAKVRAGEMPKEARERFEAAGMDPDMIRQFTREEVIDFHARGASLAGAMLTGLDLAGLDLRGADLRSTIARDCDFEGADLSGVRLDKAVWSKCRLAKANLGAIRGMAFVLQKSACDGASLAGANLKQAILKDCSLVGADFAGAVLELSILSKAAMDRANFRGASLSLTALDGAAPGADFREAVLHRCLLKKMPLDKAAFDQAKLDSTLLQQCTGAEVSFAGADLDKVRFGSSAFPKAGLRGATLTGAGLRDSDLPGADFTGAVLDNAMIEGCDLAGAVLEGVSAKRTRFTRTNLEGANMRGIDLGSGSLRKARIVAADLSGANLFGADLFKAVVGETDFSRANLKLTFLHNREDLLK